MSETLFVHIGTEPWQWLYRGRDGAVTERGHGVPPRAADRQIAFVSQADCLPLSAELPALSGARLARALPYALEDQVAGDIEAQHVAPAGRDEAGHVRALVVERDRLRQWLAALDEAGLQPGTLVPDALCLPGRPGHLALMPLGDRVLVRREGWQAAALEPDLLEVLLDDWTAGVEVIDWYGEQPPDALSGRPQTVTRHAGGLDALCGPAERRPDGLLTGEFAPARARRHRRVWAWAAIAAALALVLQFVFAGAEYWRLSRENADLSAAIEETFRATFPGKRIVEGRIRNLAEQELARLRFGQAAGFLDLLGRAGPVIRADETLVVEAIDYREGALEVRLTAPGVSALDTLEQRLQALELDASVQSASLGPDGADGRVVIRGAGT